MPGERKERSSIGSNNHTPDKEQPSSPTSCSFNLEDDVRKRKRYDMYDSFHQAQLQNMLDRGILVPLLPVKLFEPDILLPQQKPVNKLQPEKRLLMVLLEESIKDIKRQCGNRSIYRSRRTSARLDMCVHCDAMKWFTSANPTAPFSFQFVCDQLGFSASKILRHLESGMNLAHPTPHRTRAAYQ